jgi:hypothetical protein
MNILSMNMHAAIHQICCSNLMSVNPLRYEAQVDNLANPTVYVHSWWIKNNHRKTGIMMSLHFLILFIYGSLKFLLEQDK